MSRHERLTSSRRVRCMSSWDVVRSAGASCRCRTSTRCSIRRPGTTKGEVIDYYARIAPVMVPHLAGRCITLKRFPNGVDRRRASSRSAARSIGRRGCPRRSGPGDRDGDIGYCRFDEPAALVWAANMAALELHVPMAAADDLDTPLAMVFDFDPGAAGGDHGVLRDRAVGPRGARRGRAWRAGARRRARRACRCTCR